MWTQWFRPTAAGLLLLVAYLAVQPTLGSSTLAVTAAGPGASSRWQTDEYALLPAVTRHVTELAGQPRTVTWSVRYHHALFLLLIGLTLALPLGRLATGPRGVEQPPHLRRPVRTLLSIALGAALLAALAAPITTRLAWDAWWIAPDPDGFGPTTWRLFIAYALLATFVGYACAIPTMAVRRWRTARREPHGFPVELPGAATTTPRPVVPLAPAPDHSKNA